MEVEACVAEDEVADEVAEGAAAAVEEGAEDEAAEGPAAAVDEGVEDEVAEDEDGADAGASIKAGLTVLSGGP